MPLNIRIKLFIINLCYLFLIMFNDSSETKEYQEISRNIKNNSIKELKKKGWYIF